MSALSLVADRYDTDALQFFSEGGDDGPESLRAHRLVNAWEFAKLVRQSVEVGRHVIAVPFIFMKSTARFLHIHFKPAILTACPPPSIPN